MSTDDHHPDRPEAPDRAGPPDSPPEPPAEQATERSGAPAGSGSPDSDGSDTPAADGADAPAREPNGERSFLESFGRALVTANTGTVTALAVVLALVLGAIIVVVSNDQVLTRAGYFFAAPGPTFTEIGRSLSGFFGALFEGAIIDFGVLADALAGRAPWHQALYPISETLTNAAPLILTGLSFTMAFRAGLINIGGNGQAIIGAIGAGAAGFGLAGLGVELPAVLLLLVALLAGVVGGAGWGFIPGVIKARTGAHEVIVTIMLNYIAYHFLVWFIRQPFAEHPDPARTGSKPVSEGAVLPLLLGEPLRVNLGIVVALLAAVAVAWLLRRSTLGFELRTVGANAHAARASGMSVSKAYITAMAFAGGLSGLGGSVILLGTEHTLTPAVIGQTGFDGITVALLGRGRPLGTVLAGLLFGALQTGAVKMQGTYPYVPVDMVTVLQALIVLFIAAPALIKTTFRLRQERAGLELSTAKGW